MRNKYNFKSVKNPTNLKLRWTFAECQACDGIIPRDSLFIDQHGNDRIEEIDFCAIFWAENSVLICTQCSDSLRGSLHRNVLRFRLSTIRHLTLMHQTLECFKKN